MMHNMKTIKRIAMLSLFCLLWAAWIPSLALSAHAYTDAFGETEVLSYITDTVGLLTEEERLLLEAAARETADDYGCGIYAVILDDYTDYSHSMEACAEEICDRYYVGIETEGNAIFLLLSMSDRDYWILERGGATEKVPDDAFWTIEDAMLARFADDDWYGGLSAYLSQGEKVLSDLSLGVYDAYEQNNPGNMGYDDPYYDDSYDYDYDYDYGNDMEAGPVGSYFAALVVGIIAAVITCNHFKGQMKTATAATVAHEYVAQGGVDMQIRQDNFIHTTRSSRRIPRNNGSSGGYSGSRSRSSGGSRSRSGGGRSRGGKF